MPLFTNSDSSKDLERMRQVLKPAERFASATPTKWANDALSTSADDNGTIAAGASSEETIRIPPEVYASVISAGSTWMGELTIDDSVRVDGTLTGQIKARDTIYIAEGAEVDAKVDAAFVIVAGRFTGEVRGARVEILPTGEVSAEITTRALVVHDGAMVDGQIRMKTAPSSKSTSGDASTKSAPASPAARSTGGDASVNTVAAARSAPGSRDVDSSALVAEASSLLAASVPDRSPNKAADSNHQASTL